MRIRPLGLYRQSLRLGLDPTSRKAIPRSEPIEGMRSRGPAVAAIVYHAPQVLTPDSRYLKESPPFRPTMFCIGSVCQSPCQRERSRGPILTKPVPQYLNKRYPHFFSEPVSEAVPLSVSPASPASVSAAVLSSVSNLTRESGFRY
jgi:hypothetical protein